MQPEHPPPQKRYIGLDIHKFYFVAVGVDPDRNRVFGPSRADVRDLDAWARRHLTKADHVAMEMTTNTYLFHDALRPLVASVTAVHPPKVRLITGAKAKTDRKAAEALADLHAVGMLEGVWIPPTEVRMLRSLVAQRAKMVSLSTIAKNRLHAVLHRSWLVGEPPERLFDPQSREWWEHLPLHELEIERIRCDLDTLEFAQAQIARLEEILKRQTALDDRIPLIVQLPGAGWLTAVTILAAIGEVTRFPSSRNLVGYAGLGSRVHDSGQFFSTGRITKDGRRDLRRAVIDMAHVAVRSNPYWQAYYEHACIRMPWQKAIVMIAKKLLIAIWHILTDHEADRFSDAEKAARTLFGFAYEVGIRNLPDGLSARQFVRRELDRLGYHDLERFRRSGKWVTLPEELRESG